MNGLILHTLKMYLQMILLSFIDFENALLHLQNDLYYVYQVLVNYIKNCVIFTLS